MKARWRHCEQVCLIGEQLVSNDHAEKRDVTTRIADMRERWQKLRQLVALRRTRLEDAVESHQVGAGNRCAAETLYDARRGCVANGFGRTCRRVFRAVAASIYLVRYHFVAATYRQEV